MYRVCHSLSICLQVTRASSGPFSTCSSFTLVNIRLRGGRTAVSTPLRGLPFPQLSSQDVLPRGSAASEQPPSTYLPNLQMAECPRVWWPGLYPRITCYLWASVFPYSVPKCKALFCIYHCPWHSATCRRSYPILPYPLKHCQVRLLALLCLHVLIMLTHPTGLRWRLV